jgi:hypothetical protein
MLAPSFVSSSAVVKFRTQLDAKYGVISGEAEKTYIKRGRFAYILLKERSCPGCSETE